MRIFMVSTVLAGVACSSAMAEPRVALRPGLGCASLEALAVLTLPDGSSRVGSPRERRNDADLKRRGGCVDIPQGATVIVQRAWQHTARVTWDPGDGGLPQILTMPTIDFDAAERPVAPTAHQGHWRRDGETYVWMPND